MVLPRPVASKKSAALYARRYSTTAAICISTCSECGAEHGYGWWKRAGEQEHVSTEDDALSLRYLVVTAETIVELAWLREVDADFVAALVHRVYNMSTLRTSAHNSSLVQA